MAGSDGFDPRVLQELDRWVRGKGGKVQSRLISEFYAKHPANRPNLQDKLHLLADSSASKVHLVSGKGPSNGEVEYLELKELGNKPLRTPIAKSAPAPQSSTNIPEVVTLPVFKDAGEGATYAMVRDPAVVRAVLKSWEPLEPFAFDFKGDVRREGRLSFMQISNNHQQILMVDFADNPRMAEESGLREYMQSSKVKIILDSARPADAVRGVFGVEPNRIFDLSRSYVVAKERSGDPLGPNQAPSLVLILRELGLTFHRINKPEDSWFKRPLSTQQIEYSCRGVMNNVTIYERIMEMIEPLGKNVLEECFEESAKHALSLRDIMLDDGEPGADWSCTSCGFKNFAKRSTCRKCDAQRPESPFAKRPSPAKHDKSHAKPNVPKPTLVKQPAVVTPSEPAPSSAAGTTASGGLDTMEEEAIRIAMELSLREEQDRVERSKQAQLAEIENKKLAVPPAAAKSKEALAAAAQEKSSPAKVNANAKPTATTAEKPFEQLSTSTASTAASMAAQVTLSPTFAALASGKARSSNSNAVFISPNVSYPDSTFDQSYDTGYDAMPAFDPQSVANFLDESSPYMGASSFRGMFESSSSSSGNGLNHASPQSSFAPFGVGSNDGGSFGMGFDVRTIQSSILPTLPGFHAFGTPPAQVPVRQPSPPGVLSEDELVLLQLDVGLLLEEIKMEEKWSRVIEDSAVRVGARTELVQAPLPMLAKELEQRGMPLAQRTSVIKGVHARKQGMNKV